ncbi:unnamed protein product [Scytosiphon promiscuus]
MLLIRRSAQGLPRSPTATSSSRGISKFTSVCYHHRSHTDEGCQLGACCPRGVAGPPHPAGYNARAARIRLRSTVSTISKSNSSGRGSRSRNVSSTVFERLNLSPGPGVDDAPRTSAAAGRGARDKSTAAALMDHDDVEGELSRSVGAGSGAEDVGGDGLTSFLLTDIGEGIMEVEVLQWFVRPGDRVSQFDKLCEVQSDKANVEITSRYDGVVRRVHWSVGDMVQTGSVLVDIEEAAASDAGSTPAPKQPFLYSAEDEGVPELSVPRSPCPAPAAAASAASAEAAVETPISEAGTTTDQGREFVGGAGVRGGGSRRNQNKILATPAVRRLCREMLIDPKREPISGTGPGGRVLKGDVIAYAAGRSGGAAPPTTRGDTAEDRPGGVMEDVLDGLQQEQQGDYHGLEAHGSQSKPPSMVVRHDNDDDGWGSLSELVSESAVGSPAASSRESGRQAARRSPGTLAVGVDVEEVEMGVKETRKGPGVQNVKKAVPLPIKGVQRAMMEAMQRALEVPHMTFCDEVNADRLGQLRADLKAASERRGVRLSYLPLIVKATSMALTAFPTLNASLSEDKKFLLQHPSHNIGVAMDTEKGLMVPSISAVEEMSVLDIAEELNTLQRLGAAGKLGEAELTGTTFTLSNIGSIGGTYASPVILHPQVCIGALGRMQRLPRFDPASDTDEVVAARVFPVSWSADHRVVDGGTLARFSNTWKAYLENPALMLADTR